MIFYSIKNYLVVAAVALILPNPVKVLIPRKEPDKTNIGYASTFLPYDGHNNGRLACNGKRWRNVSLPLCAYRNLDTPEEQQLNCGEWVLVENRENGRVAWCRIADRGPYGKVSPSGKWFNGGIDWRRAKKYGTPRREGEYRGIIDLSPSVAKALGSDGMIDVKVYWWNNDDLHNLLNVLFWRDHSGTHKLRRIRSWN